MIGESLQVFCRLQKQILHDSWRDQSCCYWNKLEVAEGEMLNDHSCLFHQPSNTVIDGVNNHHHSFQYHLVPLSFYFEEALVHSDSYHSYCSLKSYGMKMTFSQNTEIEHHGYYFSPSCIHCHCR